MKKITENTKVTLTFNQLRSLIKESMTSEAEEDNFYNKNEFKNFEQVEIGDMGINYNDEPVIVTAIGRAGELDDEGGTIESGMEDGYIEEGDPVVIAMLVPSDIKVAYVYGSDGVLVGKKYVNVRKLRF